MMGNWLHQTVSKLYVKTRLAETESYNIKATAIFLDNKGFIGADFKRIVFGRILPSETFCYMKGNLLNQLREWLFINYDSF